MVAHFAPVNVHLRGGGKKIHWMKVFCLASLCNEAETENVTTWGPLCGWPFALLSQLFLLVGLLKMQTMLRRRRRRRRRHRRRRRRRRDSLKKKKASRVVYRGDIREKKKERMSA